jgi:hypothetical protein
MPPLAADCAEKITWPWDIDPAADLPISRRGAQNANDFCRRHSFHDAVQMGVAHAAITIDYEDGRFGDTAPLSGVINIPFLHDAALGIAQNCEWQLQLAP